MPDTRCEHRNGPLRPLRLNAFMTNGPAKAVSVPGKCTLTRTHIQRPTRSSVLHTTPPNRFECESRRVGCCANRVCTGDTRTHTRVHSTTMGHVENINSNTSHTLTHVKTSMHMLRGMGSCECVWRQIWHAVSDDGFMCVFVCCGNTHVRTGDFYVATHYRGFSSMFHITS